MKNREKHKGCRGKSPFLSYDHDVLCNATLSGDDTVERLDSLILVESTVLWQESERNDYRKLELRMIYAIKS